MNSLHNALLTWTYAAIAFLLALAITSSIGCVGRLYYHYAMSSDPRFDGEFRHIPPECSPSCSSQVNIISGLREECFLDSDDEENCGLYGVSLAAFQVGTEPEYPWELISYRGSIGSLGRSSGTMRITDAAGMSVELTATVDLSADDGDCTTDTLTIASQDGTHRYAASRVSPCP